MKRKRYSPPNSSGKPSSWFVVQGGRRKVALEIDVAPTCSPAGCGRHREGLFWSERRVFSGVASGRPAGVINLVEHDFNAPKPDRKWVTDIATLEASFSYAWCSTCTANW